MSTAILYITDNGRSLAYRLKGLYPEASVEKFRADGLSALWEKNRSLIFIMAAGIVVRAIAPYICDKKTDPAVVVLDEAGRFCVSLLSGHLGGANLVAGEIAAFLGGEAVITTASDVNSLPSLDLWARDKGLVIEDWDMLPKVGTRLINKGSLRVFSDIAIDLPGSFISSEAGSADVLITNIKTVDIPGCKEKGQLYLRPKNLIIGIGCNSGTTSTEIEETVREVLSENNLSFSSVSLIATIDIKAHEPGLVAFAEKYGLDIETFTPGQLNKVKGPARSETVFKATGAYAVAEPAAILGAGDGRLLLHKQKRGNLTMSIAEKKETRGKKQASEKGKIIVVGTGPGRLEHITPYAQRALLSSDVIVGYGTYLDLIPELLAGKEVYSTGMTKETDRCKKAVALALEGKKVAVVSGGDPGVYAMAGLVFEILKSQGQGRGRNAENTPLPEIEIVPGISALNACASRLGAPLMHDFASISLSDRMTPWPLIEKRLDAAAMADFVIVLYNPKSKGRAEHINVARDIILKHRKPETPVGIVRAAMRAEESVIVSDLKHMLDHDIDMQTTVIIGNSATFAWDGRMITPRGYLEKYGEK